MLYPSGNGFIDQVIGHIDLPVAKMFYIADKSQRYIFGIIDLTFLKSNLKASILKRQINNTKNISLTFICNVKHLCNR
jgi:hypothetical protein